MKKIKDPVDVLKDLNRRNNRGRILRTHYGDASKQVSREDVDPEVLKFMTWFSALEPTKYEIPNLLISGEGYLERIAISYGLFCMLFKAHDYDLVDVELASQIIHDFKVRRDQSRNRYVRYLIVNDCEAFSECPDAMETLIKERYKRGGSTILLGKKIFVGEDTASILRRRATTISLSSCGSAEIVNNHKHLPEGKRYE